jgi:hypothetical protein
MRYRISFSERTRSLESDNLLNINILILKDKTLIYDTTDPEKNDKSI